MAGYVTIRNRWTAASNKRYNDVYTFTVGEKSPLTFEIIDEQKGLKPQNMA